MTDAVVDAYRLPQLVRGWEAGLLAFLRARVVGGKPFAQRLAAAWHGREAMTQVSLSVYISMCSGARSSSFGSLHLYACAVLLPLWPLLKSHLETSSMTQVEQLVDVIADANIPVSQ